MLRCMCCVRCVSVWRAGAGGGWCPAHCGPPLCRCLCCSAREQPLGGILYYYSGGRRRCLRACWPLAAGPGLLLHACWRVWCGVVALPQLYRAAEQPTVLLPLPFIGPFVIIMSCYAPMYVAA